LLESYDEQRAEALWRLFVRRGTGQYPTLVTRRRLWNKSVSASLTTTDALVQR
jgi:hypothetical protein